ncbi:MAG: Hint domain-containing protein [Verrucomicrobia bacterium]|nr:Hint domain-containing protein [Verrucomicrobiota bacterium]
MKTSALLRRFLALLLLCALAGPLHARGGGGCLEQGTLVATPTGPVAVEQLRAGDTVWGLVAGRRAPSTVQAVLKVEPEHYVELAAADGAVLRVTPEHPMEVAPGVFVRADHLAAGATVVLAPASGTAPLPGVALTSARVVPAAAPAYNLLVSPGGVFFANGFAVHNKGCFLPDTPVTLADGTRRAISAVQVGDAVLAFTADGTIVRTAVRHVLTHEVTSYLILRTAGVELHVTEEHPFYVGNGTFRTAEALHAGDTVYAYDGHGLVPQRILALEHIRAPVTVYNLQTGEPHTFLADGIAVHNKGGGCFAPGTLVATPVGPRAIENLALGDTVLAPDDSGRLVPTPVEGVYLNFAPLLTLTTDRGILRTTAEHPLLAAGGDFLRADSFAVGATLLHEGAPARILAIACGDQDVPVYTLSVGAPHTFLADGFTVHNKGGGFGGGHGGSGYGSGSGGADGAWVFIGFIVFAVIIIGQIWERLKNNGGEDLDFCYTRKQIDAKALKTAELLRFIAKVDAAWTPDDLRARARAVFVELQGCWMVRDYAPMESLMMRDLYQQHCAQLAGLRQTHEINRIDGLTVEAVDLVHVNYTDQKYNRTFTALITATARDYYIDDRTQAFLRGDEQRTQFQEFWTFQFIEGAFRLREIEQTKESDALTEENLFEQFTDAGRDRIYGETAGPGGPAGPALPGEVLAKEQKITRLLNFLVQTDKIWDQTAMLATARRVYLNVLLAFQDGRPEQLAGLDATPAMAEHLREVLATNQRNGLRVEHRNLCVRKVEVVHVNNRNDRALDTFTARISSHALTIVTRGATELRHDEYVQVTVEFWTFARDGARWVLQEILPAASGEAAVARENVDEGTSAQMLEWYYSKPRAT